MVEMYDPNMSPDTLLPDGVLAQRQSVTRDDITGAWLVIVATTDTAVNRQVGQWCDQLDVACNRADDAGDGTFAVPAMVEDELGWKIGILGGEAGPLFSVWLKGLVRELVDSEQVERVYLALAEERQRLEDEGLSQKERSAALRAVMAQALEDELSVAAEPQPD
jgi:uroporphyrin-III C-methyltransferase/precorrin-2 dehydrogenase/sirohydrochlorin ferrochelatase